MPKFNFANREVHLSFSPKKENRFGASSTFDRIENILDDLVVLV